MHDLYWLTTKTVPACDIAIGDEFVGIEIYSPRWGTSYDFDLAINRVAGWYTADDEGFSGQYDSYGKMNWIIEYGVLAADYELLDEWIWDGFHCYAGNEARVRDTPSMKRTPFGSFDSWCPCMIGRNRRVWIDEGARTVALRETRMELARMIIGTPREWNSLLKRKVVELIADNLTPYEELCAISECEAGRFDFLSGLLDSVLGPDHLQGQPGDRVQAGGEMPPRSR